MEFLADGVFAIVMTLLVLELKVPELSRSVTASELLHELKHLGPVFLAFCITFILAGTYWFFHNLSMEFVTHANQKLAFINVGFLFFISLFPFSAALLGHFIRNPVAQVAYFGNQAGAALFLVLNWRYARRASLLGKVDPVIAAKLNWRLGALAIATLAAAVVAFFDQRFSFWLVPLSVMGSRVVARFREKNAKPGSHHETETTAAAHSGE
ncbi:MAG TPA: TMEM175 family protein [Terriglobales bacterium]|nr:TMEM175 family protein [Terriglobales bacterium]